MIEKYYIYIYNIEYKYDFQLFNDDLYLICNFNINNEINIKIKIMYDKYEYIFELNNIKSNIIKIGNIHNLDYKYNKINEDIKEYIKEDIKEDIFKLNGINENIIPYFTDLTESHDINNFTSIYKDTLDLPMNKQMGQYNEKISKIKNYEEDDIISINNIFLEKNINIVYPKFSTKYYSICNNYINNKYDKKYLLYHWYFFGRYNLELYFKYLLNKYSENIKLLKYPKIKYTADKNNTLLFIDDRYDPSFIYLMQLFLYSIDNTWNITLYTIEDNIKKYTADFEKLNVSAKILLLDKKFTNINDYSNLLKNPIFWHNINEDNCLLFQYDSFCMGKFDKIFLNYNYIGARWDHKASNISNINIGNGGTSFRKTRLMENLCNKYNNCENIKHFAEDVFFSHILYEEKLNNCNNYIADYFSFENIYSENSIYAHQLYKVIEIENMDNFINSKILKMLNNNFI
jgi:hypothetical protein